MMARVIAQSPGFRSLRLTHDDELDAALILAGKIDAPPGERYCFQTTYLNERYPEYRSLGAGQRLIWVLRNPYSVVYSMVFNWRRFALNELYQGCALPLATSARLRRAHLPWPLGPSAIEKACLAYSAKTAQIVALDRELPSHQLLVLEYDEVVHAPETWLPQIFRFLDTPCTSAALRSIQAGSTRKADALPPAVRKTIERLAEPTYRECLNLLRRRAASQQEVEPSR
jgi:hypothetical protein